MSKSPARVAAGKKAMRKGKTGERLLCEYLTSIGVPAEYQYHNGHKGAVDITLAEHPNVYPECKYNVGGMGLGTRLLEDAWSQACRDRGQGVTSTGEKTIKMQTPVVFWKQPYKAWVMTYMGTHGLEHVTGDDCIAGKLRELNGR